MKGDLGFPATSAETSAENKVVVSRESMVVVTGASVEAEVEGTVTLVVC